jgi:5-methylcytosine-specific restriction endonuclease McrA
MAKSFRYTDEQLAAAITSSASIRQALMALGVAAQGGNYEVVRRRIASLGIDTSHILGQGWRRGEKKPVLPPVPLEQLLTVGRFTQSAKLKRRLIQAGLKDARCEVCGGRRWMGELMPLELDHINGRRDDNRLENLRLLCPNCHAQTATYRGRNIGSATRYPVSARVPER